MQKTYLSVGELQFTLRYTDIRLAELGYIRKADDTRSSASYDETTKEFSHAA